MKPRPQHPRSLADPDELAGAAANAREAGNDAGAGDKNADVSELSYEAARDELVSVVRTLESGETTLDESMALWERGEALAQRCQAWLDGARERLDAARQDTEESNESDQ